MTNLSLNKIAHYVDYKTKKILFSEPFSDPDNVHHVYDIYIGQNYKSYDQYLKETNERNQSC